MIVKRIFYFLLLGMLFLASWGGYKIMQSNTKFDADVRFVFNRTEGRAKQEIVQQIKNYELLQNPHLFSFVSSLLGVWDNVHLGRFAIKKGMSIWQIIQMLKQNQQDNEVTFTIKKLQTKEGLAAIIGKRFLVDSASAYAFLTNNDSLAPLGVDTFSVFTLIIPDTFKVHYKSSMSALLQHFKQHKEQFWQENNRQERLRQSYLSEKQLYILASIVEEETNINEEKGKVASVYYNRLKLGMPLGADPTIKYALRRFELRRILYADLNVSSPYNTYRNKGLPPGPICTPSQQTIDAILPIPITKYLFFVANADLKGGHTFTTNFAEHAALAKAYQNSLNQKNIKR